MVKQRVGTVYTGDIINPSIGKTVVIFGYCQFNITTQTIYTNGRLSLHIEQRLLMAYINREKFLATKDPSGYRYQEHHFDGTHCEWLEYIKGSRLSVEFNNLQQETKALLLTELTERLVTLSEKSAPACKLLLDVLGDSNSVGRPKGKKGLSDEHLDNIKARELTDLEDDLKRLKI